MDVRYIDLFLNAVQNVFETMINVPYTIGKPSINKDFPEGNTTISVPIEVIELHKIAFLKGVPIISIP